MDKFVGTMLTLIFVGILYILLCQLFHPEELYGRNTNCNERATTPTNIVGIR